MNENQVVDSLRILEQEVIVHFEDIHEMLYLKEKSLIMSIQQRVKDIELDIQSCPGHAFRGFAPGIQGVFIGIIKKHRL